MNVIIVGSGAVAAELTSYIEDSNKYLAEENRLNLLGYLEFQENIAKYWAKYKLQKPVLGDIHSYEVNPGERFIIGIADVAFRKKMLTILASKGAEVIGFIHHSTIIAESCEIGKGTIIYPYCIIGPNTVLGENNFITSYSFISHDCIVGENNFFSTTGLGGRVVVGNNNFFGIRSTVVPGISIGSGAVIQAGMMVDKNVDDSSTVFYRFKEKIMAVPKSAES